MVRIKDWNYENKVMETVLIEKQIRNDIKKFCKEKAINKSKLVEEFYKTVLMRFKDGSLNASQGYCTINILRSPICKS
jgi:hypothetical protein